MPFSLRNVGLWSTGVIFIAASSLSSFSCLPSIEGVIISIIMNLMCGHSSESAKKRCAVSCWWDQLGHICCVSLSSVIFTRFLDYFDDQHHSSYLHIVPSNIFPRVMPTFVVVVISILFAMGLEASSFLRKISCLFLSVSFAFYLVCCLTIIGFDFMALNFTKNSPTEFLEINKIMCILFLKISSGISCVIISWHNEATIFFSTAIWLPFTALDKDDKMFERIILPNILYILTLITLSSLEGIRIGGEVSSVGLSLLDPIGDVYPWYRLVQVPALSCCCGMAVYQLYIPALESVARKSFIPSWAKDNRITGTKLAAIVLLVSDLKISMKRSGYELLKVDGETQDTLEDFHKLDVVSIDSGHSSNAEDDMEYKGASKRTEAGELEDTKSEITTKSWVTVIVMLLSSTIISSLLSWDLLYKRYSYIPWYIAALTVGYLIIHIQPTDEPKYANKFYNFTSFILTTVMFMMISFPNWPFLLLWSALGATFYLHEDLKRAFGRIKSNGKQKGTKRSLATLRTAPPKIEIKLYSVQLRNKPA